MTALKTYYTATCMANGCVIWDLCFSDISAFMNSVEAYRATTVFKKGTVVIEKVTASVLGDQYAPTRTHIESIATNDHHSIKNLVNRLQSS